MSLAALPDGRLLGGTTTSPGTGGERKARQAELYVLDIGTKRVEWHEAVFAGVQDYVDLCGGPRGLIYGVADRTRFFVFDPVARKVIHERAIEERLGLTVSGQGPRVFVTDPQGAIYMLLMKGIARIEPATHAIRLLAESPVSISAGGDWLDGRIYFAAGSHVYSYKVPARVD